MSFLRKLFNKSPRKILHVKETASIRLASGQIYVRHGTISEIRRAVEAFSKLTHKSTPVQIGVHLRQYSSGWTAIDFPNGITPLDLVQLIGWLNSPPGEPNVFDTVGSIRSPATSIEYRLQPESSNYLGDTLIGIASNDQFVRVYLPDVSLCELSEIESDVPLPSIASAEATDSESFSIVVEANRNFGNPKLIVTHPKDTKW